MGSGNEQEYTTVYKGKRKRSRRKVTPIITEEETVEPEKLHCELRNNTEEDKDNTPKVISEIIRMRWYNDMVQTHNMRVKMGLNNSSAANYPHGINISSNHKPLNGHLVHPVHPVHLVHHGHPVHPVPCGPSSPVRFFENSTSARLFQIAQQHPQEYIPHPAMQQFVVPLYPEKEFYEGNGFIPSQFLVQHGD